MTVPVYVSWYTHASIFLGQWIANFSMHWEQLEELRNHIAGPYPQSFRFSRFGMGLRIWISDIFLGDPNAASLATKFLRTNALMNIYVSCTNSSLWTTWIWSRRVHLHADFFDKYTEHCKCISHPADLFLKKILFGGSLGGSVVWRLPLAQGAILGSQNRVPRQAPGMEPASPFCLCLCLSLSIYHE